MSLWYWKRELYILAAALLVWSAAAVTARSGRSATRAVSLEWDASPDATVTGYIVYYGTESGRYGSSTNVGNQLQARVDGLETGRRYYFVVTAYNAEGLESVPSNEADAEIPSVPSPGPIVIEQRGGSWAVRGQGVAGVTFRIEYRESLTGGAWITLGTATADAAGSFDYVDVAGTNSASRFYRVAYP
jgi:hypothetical protein